MVRATQLSSEVVHLSCLLVIHFDPILYFFQSNIVFLFYLILYFFSIRSCISFRSHPDAKVIWTQEREGKKCMKCPQNPKSNSRKWNNWRKTQSRKYSHVWNGAWNRGWWKKSKMIQFLEQTGNTVWNRFCFSVGISVLEVYWTAINNEGVIFHFC